MLTMCEPCRAGTHVRCQRGQRTLGGDCECWCVKAKAKGTTFPEPWGLVPPGEPPQLPGPRQQNPFFSPPAIQYSSWFPRTGRYEGAPPRQRNPFFSPPAIQYSSWYARSGRYENPPGPRSKKCQAGDHDFDQVTGACKRKGCPATLTKTMFPMTRAEQEQAYGFDPERASRGFKPGDPQKGLFNPKKPKRARRATGWHDEPDEEHDLHDGSAALWRIGGKSVAVMVRPSGSAHDPGAAVQVIGRRSGSKEWVKGPLFRIQSHEFFGADRWSHPRIQEAAKEMTHSLGSGNPGYTHPPGHAYAGMSEEEVAELRRRSQALHGSMGQLGSYELNAPPGYHFADNPGMTGSYRRLAKMIPGANYVPAPVGVPWSPPPPGVRVADGWIFHDSEGWLFALGGSGGGPVASPYSMRMFKIGSSDLSLKQVADWYKQRSKNPPKPAKKKANPKAKKDPLIWVTVGGRRKKIKASAVLRMFG